MGRYAISKQKLHKKHVNHRRTMTNLGAPTKIIPEACSYTAKFLCKYSRVFFCVFTCISLELQVRTGSNLETRYRYHPRSQSCQKKISKQVWSAIMGRNGRVVFWGHTSKWCLVQIWHVFFTRCLQLICLDLILLCNLLQCWGTRSCSLHKCQGFSLFFDVGNIILESRFQIWIMSRSNDPTYLVLKSKASCLPNLETL